MIRLLCRECQELQPVRSGNVHHDEEVILRCGHTRSAGLLPTHPGAVSLEHLKSEVGRRAFPLVVQG